MSDLRSDRARRRAARLQNARIAIITILILILATGAYLVYSRQSSAPPLPTGENGITTASGLTIEDLAIGRGDEVQKGNVVSVHYTGWLEDGTKFDSSLDRNQPFSFVLGAGNVIPGWDEGVVGMRVGGKRRLEIPSNLAYGPAGVQGVIPPNATLIFEVELLEFQ